MSHKKIAILDIGQGNINSIAKAIIRSGATSHLASLPEHLLSADKIIIPGVGHFGRAMEKLQASGLLEYLNDAANVRKIPVLGICLGMQLMASRSEEGGMTSGLNWIPGYVRRLRIENDRLYKVPHIGWNSLIRRLPHKIIDSVRESDYFYFLHSYYFSPNEPSSVIADCLYENVFPCIVGKDNIVGVQFHPEKSHESGLKILQNFILY